MSSATLTKIINPPQAVGKLRLAMYAGVHLLFCNLYFWSLVWLNWPLVLSAVMVVTSVWASLDSRTYRGYGFPHSPFTVGLSCLLIWPVAFPVYLTWRQWLKLRYALKSSHTRPKISKA